MVVAALALVGFFGVCETLEYVGDYLEKLRQYAIRIDRRLARLENKEVEDGESDSE